MINAFPLAIIQLLCNRQYGIATITKDNVNFTKVERIYVTFCLVCCFNWCEVFEMKLYLIVLLIMIPVGTAV